MTAGFHIRVATPEDDAAVADLASTSADGGAVAFRTITHVRAHDAPLVTRQNIVAVDDDGNVIGSAGMTVGECWYEGEQRPYALLNSLIVHPAHRRQGIGGALARWRITYAETVHGARAVIAADIQRGNTASLANARRWATSFIGPSISVPMPMRTTAPRLAAGLTILSAEPHHYRAIAAQAVEAMKNHNLARVWTEERLARWLRWSPVDGPIHHYRIAVDRSGTIVAGLALREEARLRTMQLVRMPASIRIANSVLHVVPRDGRLRNLVIEHLWAAPGHEDAAQALWQDARWQWREHGSHLLITLDARDPIRRALRLRPWTPTTSITTAIHAWPPPSPERLVSPIE